MEQNSQTGPTTEATIFDEAFVEQMMLPWVNKTKFMDCYQFEITFEYLEQLSKDANRPVSRRGRQFLAATNFHLVFNLDISLGPSLKLLH